MDMETRRRQGRKHGRCFMQNSYIQQSLQILNLSGCSNLERFPDTSEIMKELSVLYLDGTAIKELPPSINNLPGLVTLSLKGCRELKILPSSIHMKSLKHLCLSGCSNLDNFPKISGVMKELSELYLDGTAIRELLPSIERLSMFAKLSMRNCRSLVFLPDNICKLTCLEELRLEGCKRLKSIPELSSSIHYIDAHDCTDLETVSIPMHLYNSRPCFIFSNCHKLEIPYAETRYHDPDHDQVDRWPTFSFMTLPGSKIPDWFNHQCRGSSVTVQIPPKWFDSDVLGFAVCVVSNFRGPLVSAKCVFTFKGNYAECSYTFELLHWRVSYRLLESDHVLMGIETGLTRGDWYVERDYTEFSVMVDTGVSEDSCIKSCGVRFFDVSTEESKHSSTQDYTDGAGRNKKIKR